MNGPNAGRKAYDMLIQAETGLATNCSCRSNRRDGVEEGAADVAAPSARWPERARLPVSEIGERRVVSRRGKGRIVELVAAHERARGSDRTVAEKPRLAIAEMKLVPGKARRMAKQPGHGVARAACILQALAEHDEAAALAVYRARACKLRQPGAKARGRRQRPGVELRIAAGQPAAIAVFGRRLVGERRERDDLRAGRPPALDDVGIDEGEGRVAGEGNAFARRPQR